MMYNLVDHVSCVFAGKKEEGEGRLVFLALMVHLEGGLSPCPLNYNLDFEIAQNHKITEWKGSIRPSGANPCTTQESKSKYI